MCCCMVEYAPLCQIFVQGWKWRQDPRELNSRICVMKSGSLQCDACVVGADLYSGCGTDLHCALMRPSRAEVISFVLYSEDSLLVIMTLVLGSHTAATLCIGLSFIHCFTLAKCTWCSDIMLLKWCDVFLLQGCVQVWGLYDCTCRTRDWLWRLQEDVHR